MRGWWNPSEACSVVLVEMDRQLAVILIVLGAVLITCIALMVYALTHSGGT